MMRCATDQLLYTLSLSSIPDDVGSLVGTGTHLPCEYMKHLRVRFSVLCNSQEWHQSPLVNLKELTTCDPEADPGGGGGGGGGSYLKRTPPSRISYHGSQL